MELGSLLTPAVISADPDAPLGLVAALMKDHNIGAVVIAEKRRPVGIVTDRDLALALGANGHSLHTPANEIMTRHVLAIPESTDLFTATRFLREKGVRRLPIVDADDRLVGMVTLDDLLVILGREMGNIAEGIRTEVHVR